VVLFSARRDFTPLGAPLWIFTPRESGQNNIRRA
jgi:hypothetical protein